jgi:hypothetical protein
MTRQFATLDGWSSLARSQEVQSQLGEPVTTMALHRGDLECPVNWVCPTVIRRTTRWTRPFETTNGASLAIQDRLGTVGRFPEAYLGPDEWLIHMILASELR